MKEFWNKICRILDINKIFMSDTKSKIDNRISTPVTVSEEMSQDIFFETIKEASIESKKHLTSAQFNSYVFRPTSVEKKTKEFIEAHLSVCERCRSQVNEVENNKEFYQSLPKIDI